MTRLPGGQRDDDVLHARHRRFIRVTATRRATPLPNESARRPAGAAASGCARTQPS
jgi:hypothetical protein